ncbi:hypothetical protein BJ875DRAFT_480393 [Amylocarpus encephaloides]|uniref:Uncharacterized protein n=1 Tax=Amylocarpus encephaloides TaxID=45428 RepID=A0A9P7YST1_9HELO|nr:hypothetical protein BJ875DRAFT_480393 [Amylocarpus encephaloides]
MYRLLQIFLLGLALAIAMVVSELAAVDITSPRSGPEQFITTTFSPFTTTKNFLGWPTTTPTSKFSHYSWKTLTTQAVQPCTTTFFRVTPMEEAPIKTQYISTSTAYNVVECGGCELNVVNMFGHGPVIRYTKTTTLGAVKTITADECLTVASTPPAFIPQKLIDD